MNAAEETHRPRAPGRCALLACAALLVLAACSRTPDAPSRAATKGPGSALDAREFANDDRFARWLGPCTKNEPFLADTSDMVPVLVSKLANGQVDPLHYAQAELAEIGAPAVPELRRLFDECFDNPLVSQRLQNVLAVARMMKTDAARELMSHGLEHPSETVRQYAARAIEQHPAPQHYDALAALLPIASVDLASALASAMLACDRPRFEREFTGWLETGQNKLLVRQLAEHVCDTHDPEILARFARAREKADPEVRLWLDAALAGSGDAEALARLHEGLKDENPARRILAAHALQLIGRTAELAGRLTLDPDDQIRAWIAEQVARLPPAPAATEALRSGLADRVPAVREACLAGLVAQRDGAATDLALEMLRGTRDDLEMSLRVLREPMARDPELAARALAVLTGLHRGDLQPVRCEPHTLERAIGQVPLAEAARYLCTLAERADHADRSERPERPESNGDEIQGLPAHRWYLQQAGNAGPAGRAYLRTAWASEVDPRRRIDVVMAAAYEKTPESRAFLESVAESDRATPLEILQAADLLTRFGHWSEVAPVLKRVALRVDDPVVRPALNCLLWTWFGRSP